MTLSPVWARSTVGLDQLAIGNWQLAVVVRAAAVPSASPPSSFSFHRTSHATSHEPRRVLLAGSSCLLPPVTPSPSFSLREPEPGRIEVAYILVILVILAVLSSSRERSGNQFILTKVSPTSNRRETSKSSASRRVTRPRHFISLGLIVWDL